ncbi:MAG: hypothetical protein K2H85_07800 [Allobaculum sp.]|nr:hypothetical protein [Allobaculum sp.]
MGFFRTGVKEAFDGMDKDDFVAAQVRSALMKLLPTSSATLDNVAKQLRMSKRTMPRRLEKEEGQPFLNN